MCYDVCLCYWNLTVSQQQVEAGGAAPPALLEPMRPVLVAAQMTSTAASCCSPAGGGGIGAGPTQDAAVPGAGHSISRGHEVRYPGGKETPLGENENPLGETLTPLFLQGLVLDPHKRGGKFAHK